VGKSTKADAFRPFSVEAPSRAHNKKDSLPTFSFPGQFRTSNQRDFYAKNLNQQCPADAIKKDINFEKTALSYSPSEHAYYF